MVRGPNLSGAISGTDPLKDNRLLPECTASDDSLDAVHTAEVVNALSNRIREILRSHPLNAERVAEGKGPANAVLLRGCGIRIEVREGVCFLLTVVDADWGSNVGIIFKYSIQG